MMTEIESCFEVLNQSSEYIAKQHHKSYLEALIDTAENIFHDDFVIELTNEQQKQLKEIYESFQPQRYSREDIRRAMQLAILKGIKEQAIVGTGLTPDAIVMFIGYMAKKLMRPKTIFNPAVGAGNLLTGVMNQYEDEVIGVGAEVDPTLIRLAYVNANLQQHQVELFHQDGLKEIVSPQSELTICDLPIGKYPNLEIAKQYTLYHPERDPFTHQLMIEQCIRYTADNGYLILLIPNFLFTEEGAEALRELVLQTSYIQAILQLPASLFQQGSIHKSILILQKKGSQCKKPKQILMANVPSLSHKEKLSQFIELFNEWMESEDKMIGGS